MLQTDLLASVAYIDTERFIEAGEMRIVQTEYRLQLYQDEVITSASVFKLPNVWDISYKSFSQDANLLYLHTHRGVITYKVYENPGHFVKAFKKLKNDHY